MLFESVHTVQVSYILLSKRWQFFVTTSYLSHSHELPTSKTGQSTIISEYQAKVLCVCPSVRILEQETYLETALETALSSFHPTIVTSLL